MDGKEANRPPDLVRKAIENILTCFWDMVQEDFEQRLVEQPDACHTSHLFVSFVDVAGWLKNKQIYPMDFVVVDHRDRGSIDLTEENL